MTVFRGVQKGDVVLDVGANIGAYTREALDEGASVVIAIEPGPENVACLRRNFKREIEEKRVILHHAGAARSLSGSEGRAAVSSSPSRIPASTPTERRSWWSAMITRVTAT